MQRTTKSNTIILNINDVLLVMKSVFHIHLGCFLAFVVPMMYRLYC